MATLTRRTLLVLLVSIVGLYTLQAHDTPKRSSAWPKVREMHLLIEPACVACGARGAGVELEVHHIVPFHLDRSKELDPKNLITLCRKGGHLGCSCHLTFGHAGSFSRYNPDVRQDAELMRKRLRAAQERTRKPTQVTP